MGSIRQTPGQNTRPIQHTTAEIKSSSVLQTENPAQNLLLSNAPESPTVTNSPLFVANEAHFSAQGSALSTIDLGDMPAESPQLGNFHLIDGEFIPNEAALTLREQRLDQASSKHTAHASLPAPEFYSRLADAEVFYVNGIMTDKASAEADAARIQKKLGPDAPQVKHFENKTEGFLADMREANQNATQRNTGIARMMSYEIEAVLEKDQPLYLVAHSQGGAITQEALNMVADQYREKGLDEAALKDKMSLVRVQGMGAYVEPYQLPEGVDYRLDEHPEDHIPKLVAPLAAWSYDDPNESMGMAAWRMTWGLGAGMAALGSAAVWNVSELSESVGQLPHDFKQIAAQHALESAAESGASGVNHFSYATGLVGKLGGAAFAPMMSDHTTFVADPRARELSGNAGYIPDLYDHSAYLTHKAEVQAQRVNAVQKGVIPFATTQGQANLTLSESE